MHARGLRVAGFGPGFVAHPPARGLARLMAARRSAAAMSKASVKAAAQADAGQSSPLLRLNLQAIQARTRRGGAHDLKEGHNRAWGFS